MTHAPVDLAQCPNCGRDLDGAFCAECGQKVAPVNPTLHDFLHDLVHEFLHVDGKIFQTVRLLLTRPGFLTQEYFHGRRARYVTPIRLYLIFSVAFFAVDAIAPRDGSIATVQVTASDETERAALKELGYENDQQVEEAASHAIAAWTPRIWFVLVPIFALLVKLMTRGSGRNYPQHVYFALHVHAAAFAILLLGALTRFAGPTTTFSQGLRIVAGTAMLVYVVVAFRRTYGGTAARVILRVAVIGVIYLVVSILLLLTVVLPVALPAIRAVS